MKNILNKRYEFYRDMAFLLGGAIVADSIKILAQLMPNVGKITLNLITASLVVGFASCIIMMYKKGG